MNPISTSTRNAASEQLRTVQCLRAIAALFVVGFHSTLLLHDNFFPNFRPWDNGNSGVDLFFVLSGFLITTILIEEHRRTGAIDLRNFWIRRGRRLMPALFVQLTSHRQMNAHRVP